MNQKTFRVLTPFSVKAATTPPHDPETCSTEDTEVIKISGYANFSGLVEEGDVFIDLVGDVVVPAGIDVGVWKKNPQILLHHERDHTIGRGLSVVKKKDGLYIEAEIHKGAMCEEDFYRVKSGLLSFFSIGFRTMAGEFKKVGDRNVYFITKSLLLECSVVGIPANGESAFRIIKSLPDDEGFYAGDLEGKEFYQSNDNGNQHQPEGESMFKAKNRELLPADVVKELEAHGMTAELDAEKELSFSDIVAHVAALVTTQLEAKAAATEAARVEAEAKAAEEAETARVEAEAKAAEEAEAVKAATAAEEAEAEEQIKALVEAITVLTKALEIE